MYQLLNKPHNGRLAALFPEVTHAEFSRRELECTVGFNREKIYGSPWENFHWLADVPVVI